MNICWSLVPQGFTPTPSWSGPETPYYGHSRPCSTLLCAEVFVERLYSLLYIPASPMEPGAAVTLPWSHCSALAHNQDSEDR